MNINGIETQYQNYAASGTSSTKRSSSEGMFGSFSQAIVNWEKRSKEALDKEQENDSNGSIQMSEKQWCNLMKKVDNAINTFKDKQKEQKQEGKNFISKDTVAVTPKTDTQLCDPKLDQTFAFSVFLTASGKRD